jgi:magnesium chelatase family protein
MPSKVYSAAVVGVEAFEVEIEVHAGWGNTDKIAVVGLPDTAVKESKDRVTSAICNSDLRWPFKRLPSKLSGAKRRLEIVLRVVGLRASFPNPGIWFEDSDFLFCPDA